MQVYKCCRVSISTDPGPHRLCCMMLDNHQERGGTIGEYTITSEIRLIDFERKYAITRNSIYKWED